MVTRIYAVKPATERFKNLSNNVFSSGFTSTAAQEERLFVPRRSTAGTFDVDRIFRLTKKRQGLANHPDAAARYALTRARNAVAEALRTERLTRPTVCTQCNADAPGRMTAQFPDLTKPMEVEWICAQCARKRWIARGDRAPAVQLTADVPKFKTLQSYSRKRGARKSDAGVLMRPEETVVSRGA